MQKLLFILLGSCLIIADAHAQISNYNHAPVIVGQKDLHPGPGEMIAITPDDLILGDMEQGNYGEYEILLDAGKSYSIKGSSIIPAPGFLGLLIVPCRINDGELSSNTFPLEVLVSEEGMSGRLKPWRSFYVAMEGDDSNPGTEESPFASLERALQEIREIKKGILLPEGGFEVLIRKGSYPVYNTIHLDEGISGAPGSPLVIRSLPGEEVFFQGGSRLDYHAFKPISTPGFKERILDKEAAEKVLEIDLNTQGIKELGASSRRGYGIRKEELPEVALAVNGAIQILARYPNESYSKQILKVTDPKYAFTTGDTHLALWKNTEHIWLDGSICKPWEWSMNQVESIDPETLEIRLKNPEYSEIDAATPIYHFKNIPEEIDMPGEYYIDAEAGKLYYLPIDGFSPSSHLYLTRLKEAMIEVDEKVSDLWLEGIIFENGRSAAIHLRGERNRIRSCEVRCFAQTGITVAGSRHVISGSHIHHIGMEAVILNPERSSNPMLIPSYNVVRNTEISHFSLWHRAYKPGLRIQGVGTGISHCLIHHGPHMGITISGNDHVFEYNDVHHTPEEFSDMLSIYIITGNSPQYRGTVVRRNYFHDVNTKWKQGAGVYMDNETYGVAVLENFFHNSGGEESGWSVMIHGGGDNIVRNNVFVDCVFPFMVSSRLNTYAKDRLERYLNRWGRTFQERYPYLDTSRCRHLIRYPELVHFFDDDNGQGPSTPYTFDIQKNADGEITNYWTRRTPATNVFENNLIYNSPETPFKMGVEKEGVREIREFYVVNGFRFLDGELLDQLLHSNNHLWKSNPGFVDYTNNDFTLKEDAEAVQKIPGLDQIPFMKIGLD